MRGDPLCREQWMEGIVRAEAKGGYKVERIGPRLSDLMDLA